MSRKGSPSGLLFLCLRQFHAGYINEISYNKAHEGMTSGSMTLRQEYEVLLQEKSKFVILRAAEIDGKLVLVVNWIGGKHD